MKQYLEAVRNILKNGKFVGDDRTGVGTFKLFGLQMRFPNIGKQFPLVTAKHTPLRSIWFELEMFLKGITSVRFLNEKGIKIWNDNIIPGTEVYRQATPQEVAKAIKEKFGYKSVKIAVINRDIDVINLDNGAKIYLDLDKPGTIANVNGTLVLGPRESSPTDQVDLYLIGNRKHFGDQGGLERWAVRVAELYDVPTEVIEDGQLGPMYGQQWRAVEAIKIASGERTEKLLGMGYQRYMGNYKIGDTPVFGHDVLHKTIDQIAEVIKSLRTNPSSRRHVVDAWNVADLDEMALAPCHALFQFDAEPLTLQERVDIIFEKDVFGSYGEFSEWTMLFEEDTGAPPSEQVSHKKLTELGVPTHRLNCQLYQRKLNCALVA